jgi:hypothetical protein
MILNKFLSKITTPISFGKPRTYHLKRYFKIFINLNYIGGFLYAFYFYIRSSRQTHMLERRLWANESWSILTFYGLFIYLFYLERSALEDQPGLYRFTQIKAQQVVNNSASQLKNWFKSLKENPDSYEFDSHLGVLVETGSLSESGAIFSTQEVFAGLKFKFKFKVVEVTQNKFEFKLIEPKWLSSLGIKGKFELVPVDEKQTILKLVIFNKAHDYFTRVVAMIFLYLSPVRFLIAKQINKETEFVKQKVEA